MKKKTRCERLHRSLKKGVKVYIMERTENKIFQATIKSKEPWRLAYNESFWITIYPNKCLRVHFFDLSKDKETMLKRCLRKETRVRAFHKKRLIEAEENLVNLKKQLTTV
jgi:hypothetical protein